MTLYNYIDYWDGKRDLANYSIGKKIKILRILKKLDFETVLEFGPGQGELTNLILENFKVKKYLAVELSPLYILQLPKEIEIINKNALDFQIKEKFDLVISAHFLLHIKPEDIEKIIEKMQGFSSKYFIHIDPIKELINREWEYYNFPHDYNNLHKTTKFYQIDKYVGLWLKK